MTMEFLIDHSKKIIIALLAVAIAMAGYFFSKPKKFTLSVEDQIPFEHSLMVHDKKISSFRSPAALKSEEERLQKIAEKTEKKKDEKDSSLDLDKDDPQSPASKSEWAASDRVLPPSYIRSGTSSQSPTATKKGSDNTQTAAGGKRVMGPIYGGFNKPPTQAPVPATTTSSPRNSSSSVKDPVIKGYIKPLQGLIAYQSSNPFFSSAYANTCNDARLLLLDLTQMSILLDNPIDEETLASNTKFEFEPEDLNLDLNTPNRYMLQTTGCLVNYQRIISSFYVDQNLDQSTTLISKIINTRIASSISTVTPDALDNLYSIVMASLNDGDSFEDIYLKLDTSPALTQAFQNTFNGGATQELKDAAPDILAYTIHKNINEKSTYAYSVTAGHWDPNYIHGYEWQVDGVTKGTTPTWNYTPSGNSSANQVITLILGFKNSGDALVDRSKPYHKIDINVAVDNIYPAVAPTFTLASSSVNPTPTRNLDLEISTGNLVDGIYDQCDSFSDFAIVEDNAIPDSSDFIYQCTTGPVQSLSYAIQRSGDGPVELKLWTRDVDGRLSTIPWNMSMTLDTTAPLIAFKDIEPNYVADSTETIEWELTEPHATSAQSFILEFYDGTAWSNLPLVASTDGPHTSEVFSTSYHFPDISASGAKFRITYEDSLGHSTTIESTAFDIQRSLLTSTPTNLDFGSVLNKNQSPLFTMNINNTGPVATPSCSPSLLGGSHSGDFLLIGDGCSGVAIPSGGSCTLSFKAAPVAKGTRNSNVTIACGGTAYSTTLTVASLNNPPVTAALSATTSEETAVSMTLGPSTDLDGDTLSFTVIASPTKGALSGCGVSGTDYVCTYTPSLNQTGTDSFTFKSNDGTVDSNTSTASISITPVNDAPVLVATQTVSTSEDTPVNFTLNAAADVDGDTLSYSIVSGPAQGSLSCTGTSCTYTPPADFEGSTTFTYRANDGTVNSNLATVTVNVSATNDPPIIGADQSVTTPEDTAVNFTLNTATDIDVPAQTLSYKLISSPTKGTLSNCIDTGSYQTDRTCTYTPNANVTGTDTFTYRAYDSIADSSSVATVTITITPENDAPALASTQSVTTAEDTPLTFNLNAGTDTESDPLTYIRVSSTSNGTISCTGGSSRSCTYTPDLNFNGTDTFTYKTNDGVADSNTATVTITVTPVNDPPVMAANQTFSTNDNANLVINLSPATDIDGGALSYKIVSAPAHGVLSNCITTGTYGTDLSCDYQANTNYDGQDTFTFIAYDTFTDATSVATVTINVTDATPSPAPAIILASAEYTNSTATTYTATNCTDTPFIYINEGSAPAAGAAGWQACSTTAAALSYTLGSSQGAHTVKAWSKDTFGNVSTSSTNISVYYDTVVPAMSLTTPPAQKGGAGYSFAWTATESYTTTALNFTVEAFNGTSWASVGTTASTAGPLTSTAFSRSATVPLVDTTTAAFRVTFTDRAGNSNTVTSANFTIDSTPPATTISTPAANSYHLSSATITGNCEVGRTVDFSGDIQTSFSIACTTGSYSQLVNFSNGDGNKNINVAQTDAVGNTTSLSRNLIRDELSPVLARTTGASPYFTRNNTPNAWGGTCEGNYTITVSGDESTTFNCSAGAWSWTPSPKLVDGVFTYNLVQTDAAGNTSAPPLALSWERDATPPSFTVASPVTASTGQTVGLTNNLNAVTFSGNCEGTNSISITGSSTETISCSSSSWEWTTSSYITDATRSYTFTQADSAGNTAVMTVNWTRDTTGPGLTLAANLKKTNADTVQFNGTCETGVDVVVGGTESQTIGCPAGTWSFTSSSYTTDATMNFTFTQTFTVSPFNSTSTSGTWIRETDAPQVSLFSTTASNPSKSSFIPVAVNANSQNSSVYVSHICVRPDDTSKPAANHACWIAVNSPEVGQALGPVLTLSNYSTLIGWTPKNYDLYMFVKDEAGNVSNLSSSGNGTLGTDKINITYDPGIAPTVFNVIAANVNNPPLPPTRAQSEVPAGSDVFIRWSATDNNPLPAGSISLYYTSNEIDFNTIVTGLDNSDYGCGVTLAANQGCYRWTGGSPFNTAYKIRVRVTDNTQISSQLISNPLNVGFIKIIAGNTESGLGGSAQTAMFYTKRHGDQPDPQTLVVSKDGNFYFADNERGIITIDQADGKQKIFIRKTGVSSGDGGPAVNATIQHANKITMDYQNRLLIHDRDRIRRVDLRQSTPTIETIIGGGSDGNDTVANPLHVSMYGWDPNDWWNQAVVFFATPNGDIHFQSDHAFKEHWQTSWRLRIYKEATKQVVSKYVTGYGTSQNFSQDIMKCRLINMGFRFNPANSVFTGATFMSWSELAWAGCNHAGDIVRGHMDPITFEAIPVADDGYRWWHYQHYTGMDGNLYVFEDRRGLQRKNFDGTYTRVLGTGTKGECPDGTAHLSCHVDLQSVFVSATGKIYFTDRGQIRTVDENGNIKTLFGQKLSYGHGVNALNARMSDVTRAYYTNAGKIITNDRGGNYIKEFTIEGNINIIAGDGSARNIDLASPAPFNPILEADWVVVDKVSGDLFTSLYSSGYGTYARLDRTTGFWSHIIGDQAAGTHFTTADGTPGLNIAAQQNEFNRGLPIAFENNHFILNRMRHNFTDRRWEDTMMKAYDAGDVYRQSHLIGTTGWAPDNNDRNLCDATTPVPGSSCDFPHWDSIRDVQWDPVLGRYIFVFMYGNGSEREVYEVYPGGNVRFMGQVANAIHDNFMFRWEAGQEILYYCNGTKIRKHNFTTNLDLGELPWSMPNLSCRGLSMGYNSTNNSLIFPFQQNGLSGVAEYFLP